MEQWKDKMPPLTVEEQMDLLNQIHKSTSQIKGLERKIRRLEHDMEYINTMYENALRLNDFNSKEKEKQYMYNRLLLDSCPTVLIVLNNELRYIIGTSSQLAKQLGYTDERELNNLRLQEIFNSTTDDGWIKRTVNNCSLVLENKETMQYTDEIASPDKRKIYTNITISPAMDKESALQGVVFVMHDITDLISAKEEALAALETKSLFLANMSHEIRTPMNAIRGMSNLLNATELNVIQKSYISNILNSSDSLLTIIDDLLDFSKIDANQLELIKQNYRLSDLLNDTTNLINLKATQKGLSFITDIDPTLPIEVYGDELRIKQIISNILGNAVKYTKEGYVKLSVTSQYIDGEFILIVAVSDTGIGMKKENLESIFTAFAQFDSKKNIGIQGTGLGLTITRNLVLLMNGHIEVESTYGEGSTFIVYLPQKIVNSTHFAMVENPGTKRLLVFGNSDGSDSIEVMLNRLFLHNDYLKEPSLLREYLKKNTYTHIIYWDNFAPDVICQNHDLLANTQHIVVKDLSLVTNLDSTSKIHILYEPVLISNLVRYINNNFDGLYNCYTSEEELGQFLIHDVNILVVDDNEVNLLVCLELLKHYGIEAHSAQSGFEAVKMASRINYDLIFMDHMMPEMDGIETTIKIREINDYYRSSPIVALTANAIIGMKEFMLENHMDDFLSKPLEITELNYILRKWIPESKFEYITEEKIEVVNLEINSVLLNKIEKETNLEVRQAIKLIGGSETTYLNILYTFKNKLCQNKDRLLKDMELCNWNDFRIEIHAFKSSLYNIGATALSEKARKMELAASTENYLYIHRSITNFIYEIEILYEKLSALLPLRITNGKKDTATAEQTINLKTKINKIIKLVKELEQDLIIEEIEKLQDLSYNATIDNLLSDLKVTIEDFDYDHAVYLIQLILDEL